MGSWGILRNLPDIIQKGKRVYRHDLPPVITILDTLLELTDVICFRAPLSQLLAERAPDYATALLGHKAAVDSTKSPQREEAYASKKWI